ncbi:hypothetical protein [Phaffia rhodozyma]|uniref:Uncharacterized protein n=1 Tax=Phaffia rhodozyma TaxID=264483 RepID=A0A0F7SUP7_PHARH|nr:hypothetical protein [Phaffia rhodozyma]
MYPFVLKYLLSFSSPFLSFASSLSVLALYSSPYVLSSLCYLPSYFSILCVFISLSIPASNLTSTKPVLIGATIFLLSFELFILILLFTFRFGPCFAEFSSSISICYLRSHD